MDVVELGCVNVNVNTYPAVVSLVNLYAKVGAPVEPSDVARLMGTFRRDHPELARRGLTSAVKMGYAIAFRKRVNSPRLLYEPTLLGAVDGGIFLGIARALMQSDVDLNAIPPKVLCTTVMFMRFPVLNQLMYDYQILGFFGRYLSKGTARVLRDLMCSAIAAKTLANVKIMEVKPRHYSCVMRMVSNSAWALLRAPKFEDTKFKAAPVFNKIRITFMQRLVQRLRQ